MTMTPNPYIVSFETIILGLFNYSDSPLHNPTHQDGDSHFWRHLPLTIFGRGVTFHDGKRSRQIISNFANLDLPAMKGLSSRERIFSCVHVTSSQFSLRYSHQNSNKGTFSFFWPRNPFINIDVLPQTKTIQKRRTKGRWTEKIPSNPTVGSTSKNCTRAWCECSQHEKFLSLKRNMGVSTWIYRSGNIWISFTSNFPEIAQIFGGFHIPKPPFEVTSRILSL